MHVRFGMFRPARRSGASTLAVLAALAIGVVAGTPAANAQATCQALVNPIVVRGEGLTERMGDILLTCTGGVPFQGVNGNLTIFLSVPMTNRVNSSGQTDLGLTVDSGFGPLPANVPARYISSNSLSFSGFAFNMSATGTVNIRLSNLRGDANQAGLSNGRQITASLSFTAGSLISFTNNVFPVGTVLRSLYSSYTSRLICGPSGTATLDTNSVSSALALQLPFATVRVTEGFNSSLSPRSDISFQNADFGSRVILHFSGVPSGARIFVPDGVVGSDGTTPTSAGDYGIPPSGGTYTPGMGSLLLLRVISADTNGGGIGSSAGMAAPAATAFFDSLSEVTITPDGTGQAVYEVFDSNPFGIQSATIPSFITIPAGVIQNFALISEDVFLGAISSSLSTSPDSQIPRYGLVLPPNDCSILGDCGASYFPKFGLNVSAFDVSMSTLDVIKSRYIVIGNSGTGNFLWNATIRYLSGSSQGYQWLKLSQTQGINQNTIELDLVPGALPSGIYDALITFDAGPIAGSGQVRVTMRLSFQGPKPILINVVNAANQKPGILVPGSKVTILGDRLLGNTTSVMFDNSPARVLNANSISRMDVQVPYDIAGKPQSLVTVTIDNTTSDGVLIPIGVSNPAIFTPGVVNADNSFNGPFNGALTGSTVSVLSSGLPVAGVYSGQIHDRIITGDSLVYAGPHPSLIGVQMLQMVVPPDLPAMTTSVYVCGGLTTDTQVCSDGVDISLITGAPPSPSLAVRRANQ